MAASWSSVQPAGPDAAATPSLTAAPCHHHQQQQSRMPCRETSHCTENNTERYEGCLRVRRRGEPALDEEKLCTWPRNRLGAVEGDRRPEKPRSRLFGELKGVLSGFQRPVCE